MVASPLAGAAADRPMGAARVLTALLAPVVIGPLLAVGDSWPTRLRGVGIPKGPLEVDIDTSAATRPLRPYGS